MAKSAQDKEHIIQKIFSLAKEALELQLNNSDFPKSVELAEESLSLAKSLDPDDLLLQAPATVILGINLFSKGNYLEALPLLLAATDIYKDAPAVEWTVHAYYYLGVIYTELSLHAEALTSHQEQFQLAETLGLIEYMASATRRIGVAHDLLKQYDRAMEYYHESMKLYQTIQKRSGIAGVYNNMSIVSWNQGDYQQALDYGLKGAELFEESEHLTGLSSVYGNIARAYLDLGHQDEALDYARKSVSYARESTRTSTIIFAQTHLGSVLSKIGQTDEALTILQQTLDMVVETDNYLREAEIYRIMSETYEALGDYQMALDYHKRLHESYISITNEALNSGFAYLETIHRTRTAQTEANLQRQLREQEQRQHESLSEMKDAFVASLSHDLKNPLTSAMLSTQFLERILNGNEQGMKHVKRLHSSMDKMRLLITDVLDLARFETGQALDLQPVSIIPLIEECIDSHKHQALEKAITINFSSSSEQLEVMLDSNQIKRVFDNLISNAIKYNHENGQIEIRVRHATDALQFEVSDTGMGIPQDLQSHIFERFARIENGPHAKIDGTGLGLSIVKSIVEQHGGTITVRSNDGVGTTFTISIPH